MLNAKSLLLGVTTFFLFISVMIFSANVYGYEQQSFEKINIIGEESVYGVYDPSVEYGDDGIGWLAYTAISENDKVFSLETHIAKSLDNGKTWTKISRANSAENKLVVLGGKEVDVIYRSETPALLYDPSDPEEGRRWKLFTANGFSTDGTERGTKWEYVTINYKYAKTPEEFISTEDISLFGSRYCTLPACSVKYNLNDFHSDLKDVVFYEEPGSLAKDGVIYLTLSAVTKIGERETTQNTIALSSRDHGKTWDYLGILTSKEDAVNLDYSELTSSSMTEENGRLFLLLSPVKKKSFPPRLEYNGVYVFEFEDIDKAKLRRDAGGNLIVSKYIPAIRTTSVGGGQSDYHEKNTYGGIIMAQTDVQAQDKFQIYNTFQAPPSAIIPGDLDGDKQAGCFNDFILFGKDYGLTSGFNPAADMDKDNDVDIDDFILFGKIWSGC